LIEGHASGRTIDFLKVDVEGAERDVLSSFDPATIRPTVILVEAISPLQNVANHDDWESILLDNGYAFSAFDGINRFYVPVERAELIDALAYPVSLLDRYESYHSVSQRSREREALERAAALADESASLVRENARLSRENATLTRENARLAWENAKLSAQDVDALAQVRAIEQTFSWKITRPLRSVRRVQLRWVGTHRQGPLARIPGRVRPTTPRSAVRELEHSFARRLSQAAHVLSPESQIPSDSSIDEALDALESALRVANESDRAKAWVCLVAADGSFPKENSVDRVARRMRMEGTTGVRSELLSRFDKALGSGSATTAHLDVRRDRVVVDVTHTVSNSLQTGIQRVVRETVSRWIDAGRPVDLVHFNFAAQSQRLLSQSEYARLRGWREHLGRSGAKMSTRLPEEASGDVVVPWRCQFIVPELIADRERCSAYRVLASASVLRSFSFVGFDLIPIVAADTVADGMPGAFADYLSILKRADRISAISRTSADGFRAFADMTASESLRKPEVVAHALPVDAPDLDPETMEAARRTLGVGTTPLIVVVGSHEPRKNHVSVLEAAERIWAGGATFELLFIGGSGWKSEEFDDLVTSLLSTGRQIIVRKRCTEEELWAAYSLARFTVFASLLEGFGLPVAESLASGTPAITSSHGSMAEIAEGGGCLTVDPRDIDALERAMSKLLRDDDLLKRLRREAMSRPNRTWDAYAEELWGFFAGLGTQ
jgi:glycosyltransferase involved in cell wall biosynthesis